MFFPLTLIAGNYSNSQKDNFDIFLPNWLAKHNKLIFTTIFHSGANDSRGARYPKPINLRKYSVKKIT